MHEVRRQILGACAVCLAVLACHRNDSDTDARTQVIAALRDSLGRDATPDVSFIENGGRPKSHLYVTFDTSVTANVSDSAFGLRARDLARLVVRHYARSSELDSINVAVREPLRPGLWRVHHQRAFAIGDLNAAVDSVRAAEAAAVDAWNRGDLEAHIAIFADTGTGGPPFRNGGRSLARTSLAPLIRRRSVLRVDSLQVAALGPDYIRASGRWVLSDSGRTGDGWFTHIWARLPEGWRITYEHSQ